MKGKGKRGSRARWGWLEGEGAGRQEGGGIGAEEGRGHIQYPAGAQLSHLLRRLDNYIWLIDGRSGGLVDRSSSIS